MHGVYYAAAHTSGPALALWNTESMAEGVEDGGRSQDYALADAPMWGRVAVATAPQHNRPSGGSPPPTWTVCWRGSTEAPITRNSPPLH